MKKICLAPCTLLLVILILIPKTHAHGDENLGPNGGYIQMPGAYHTEAVPSGKNQLKIYLLDINWQNPSIVHSSVQVHYSSNPAQSQSKHLKASCLKIHNYFNCTFPKSIDLEKEGQIEISSERLGQKGNNVQYTLPFKLKGTSAPTK